MYRRRLGQYAPSWGCAVLHRLSDSSPVAELRSVAAYRRKVTRGDSGSMIGDLLIDLGLLLTGSDGLIGQWGTTLRSRDGSAASILWRRTSDEADDRDQRRGKDPFHEAVDPSSNQGTHRRSAIRDPARTPGSPPGSGVGKTPWARPIARTPYRLACPSWGRRSSAVAPVIQNGQAAVLRALRASRSLRIPLAWTSASAPKQPSCHVDPLARRGTAYGAVTVSVPLIPRLSWPESEQKMV